jgi:hypothetical protein
VERHGVVYDPMRRTWRLSRDMSVNYLLAAKKPEAAADRSKEAATGDRIMS